MKTYPGKTDGHGRLIAFEMDNVYVSTWKLRNLLSSVSHVTNVQKPTRNDFEGTCVCFNYHDHPFMVLEPFGDNSRYLIGPTDPAKSALDIRPLQAVFEKYQPNFLVKIIGDIITLNLAGLARKRG